MKPETFVCGYEQNHNLASETDSPASQTPPAVVVALLAIKGRVKVAGKWSGKISGEFVPANSSKPSKKVIAQLHIRRLTNFILFFITCSSALLILTLLHNPFFQKRRRRG